MAAVQAREDLRSAEYLAEKLNVHPKTIARWVRVGKIQPDEIHKRWGKDNKEIDIALFRESTVERLVDEMGKGK